ncbi:DNA directed RNA polymerase [Gaertneriomyces semiglobifer]|nr:DNA directed RNA polymerase [Gaertneriomyces semiglobifer]
MDGDSQQQVFQQKLAPPVAEMAYICGECGVENSLKPREPVRCKECGYRIMYKKRTKRIRRSMIPKLLEP